jgi:hypothetical protein
MMERMMSWPIDEVLQKMASDHIGIMDLAGELESGRGYPCKMKIGTHKYSPYVDNDEENKVHDSMDRKKEDEDVIWY